MQSWDTASTENATSDYSVCTTWACIRGSLYLLDVYRKRVNYKTLKEDFISLREKWNPHSIVIEEKASGYQLINEFSDFFPIFPYKPLVNKITRVLLCIPFIQAGFLFLPFYASWLHDFESELCAFPNPSSHDDQVDSLAQVIAWSNASIPSQSPQLRLIENACCLTSHNLWLLNIFT